MGPWRTAVPEFAMLNEHAYELGSTVIVKTVCYGTFSGGVPRTQRLLARRSDGQLGGRHVLRLTQRRLQVPLAGELTTVSYVTRRAVGGTQYFGVQ